MSLLSQISLARMFGVEGGLSDHVLPKNLNESIDSMSGRGNKRKSKKNGRKNNSNPYR